MKLFWDDLIDYSYLFVTRNSEGRKDIHRTSERGIKITEFRNRPWNI